MSGGHWQYLSRAMEDAAEGTRRAGLAMELLAQIEHELDWGHSGDSCLDCARLRTISAIEHYLDDNAYSNQAALAILRDYSQNLCPKDEERKRGK